MAIKKYKPTSNGRRGMTVSDFAEITTSTPEKSLLAPLKSKGGQLVRSAGTSAQVLGKEGKYVLVRLNSGEVRMILSECRASIGQVGNEQHELINIGKAGRNRWLGKRPTVRGSVMNPNDHPH